MARRDTGPTCKHCGLRIRLVSLTIPGVPKAHEFYQHIGGTDASACMPTYATPKD